MFFSIWEMEQSEAVNFEHVIMKFNGRTFPRVAGDGWRVAGGGLKIYMKIKYYNKILLLIMI